MNGFLPSRTEAEVFADLEQLCALPGYIHALAMISLRDNMVRFDGEFGSEALSASYTADRTVRTEFTALMGLLIKSAIDFTPPRSADLASMMTKTHELLQELHMCLNAPMFAAMGEAFNAKKMEQVEIPSPFSSAGVLREAIFYGGESAYNFQYREFAKDRYAADADWLLANKGFHIKDAHALASAVSRLQSRKLTYKLSQLKAKDQDLWSVLPGFSFTLPEIAVEAGLADNVALAVLSAFSCPQSPTNAVFASLGDFNIAQAFPLLLGDDGTYICLQTYGLVEAIYDSPFYWMAGDKRYKGEAFNHRGEFTERIVANRLAAVFSDEHVLRNVNIFKNDVCIGEVDVLVLFADRAIVVQCKSKKMTLEARKGNDLQLRDDFKKSVHDAYDQALLCAQSLLDPDLTFVLENGDSIEIPEISEIYPLCVVSDHYPALSVQAREFLKIETTKVIQPPLVTDIFLIDVLTELLASPLYLLSYVNRRVNYRDQVHTIQELTILGYHLSNNLWIEDPSHMVMLAEDLAMPLDAAMAVRREGVKGAATPKGILTHLKGTILGRVLGAIETRPEAGLVDLGFMLLTLDDSTLAQLNKGMAEVSERTRRDRLRHDFTIAFEDGGAGLTVQCSQASNVQALNELSDYCARRKYKHRAERWFGLAIRADDGLPKFGINLRSPWVADADMDRRTQGMSSGTPLRAPPPGVQKQGRNDLCACGSGKKHKKCCLTA